MGMNYVLHGDWDGQSLIYANHKGVRRQLEVPLRLPQQHSVAARLLLACEHLENVFTTRIRILLSINDSKNTGS
jgi:hypothetical protein